MNEPAALLMFALIPGLALLSAARARQAGPSLPDEVVATIYVRKGRLVLRRRKP